MAVEWTEVNGVSLRVARHGVGEPVVVLLHEMAGAIESWDDLVDVLGVAQVLRYDQRGFGLSEKSFPLTMEKLVDDLAALLGAAGVNKPVVLAGPALGAALALAFAVRFPERVRGLVLSSPAIGGTTPSARIGMEARHAAIRSGGLRAVTESMMERTYPSDVSWDARRFERHRKRWLACDPEAFIAVNEMLADLDLQPHLAKVAAPALVIGCTHDPIRPPARSAEIAAQMPNARFVECASGHYLPLQHPEEFALQLRGFLRSLG